MPGRRGPVSRRGKNDRQGPPQRPHPRGGGGGGGGSSGGGGGGGKYPYRRGPMRRANNGPITCPMCGAVVPDLKAHIRQRHDDAESHPRQ